MASTPRSTTSLRLLSSSSSSTTGGCSTLLPADASNSLVRHTTGSCSLVSVSPVASSLSSSSNPTVDPKDSLLLRHKKNINHLFINNATASNLSKNCNNKSNTNITSITTTTTTQNKATAAYKNNNVTVTPTLCGDNSSCSRIGFVFFQDTSSSSDTEIFNNQTTSSTDLNCFSTASTGSGRSFKATAAQDNKTAPLKKGRISESSPFPRQEETHSNPLIMQVQYPPLQVETTPCQISSSPSTQSYATSENNSVTNACSGDNTTDLVSTINTVPSATNESSTCPSPTSEPSHTSTNGNILDTVTTTTTTNNDISTSTINQSLVVALDTNLSHNTIAAMSHTNEVNSTITSDNNPCLDIPLSSTNVAVSKTLSTQSTNCTVYTDAETKSNITSTDCSSLSDNNSSETASSDNTSPTNNTTSPTMSVPTKPTLTGPKYKLLTEGEIQVCRLNHTRTIVSKIMNSKYLRRWETHHLLLDHNEIRSTSPTGFMSSSIPYSSIEDIHTVSRWDAGHKFCIRITIQDGSVLLQANSSYLRDQWLHSIKWKKHVHKYEKLLKTARRPEVVVKEIKNMIDVSLTIPIHDTSVYQFPLDLVSELLHTTNSELISKSAHENIIIALTPLLESNHPTQEICEFLIRHCRKSPRSSIVIDLFTPVAQRILKHNTDFGKLPNTRRFVQEYILALNSQNDGFKVVQAFVRNMHGQSSTCPHPRVLPNLVAVCLASIYLCYDEKKKGLLNNSCISEEDWNKKLLCYIRIFETMSQYDDWRYILGSLLQPIPFPEDAVGHAFFTSHMKTVIRIIASDDHCDTHQTILSIRENKEGWFHLYCPGNICCDDDGELWSIMLQTLIKCCCRRKKFLQELSKSVNPVMLLALRGKETAMDALCGMLEMDVISSNDLKMQMITTLQTTPIGKKMYTSLCERQIALRELQQKGGPKKLSLPPQSTDADLVKMLSSGSFGNLESLSLAFTQVTSACASELIKLTTLRSLNLWSTQFGDAGLQLISEHLPRLQILNLCETPVTDKGLSCLASLKNLRKLNLNSTNLSALTFEGLKEKLPVLQECDVRYTEAW